MNKIVLASLIGIIIVIALTVIIFLPNKDRPSDFIQVKRDINQGLAYNLCNLSDKYYTQPDFYPSYQKFIDKPHDYSRWGVHGYGAYPGDIGYTVKDMKAEQTVTVCTFVHSSFEVETFQGVKLAVSDIPEQFDVSFEPNNFLLYPAFPDTKRNDKWAHKIKMIITAKKDIPHGNYDFQVKTISPDDSTEFRNEMKQYSLNTYQCPWIGQCDPNIIELRKRVYEDAGQFEASNFFKFNLKVN